MVDVRGARQVRGLVGNVASQGCRVLSAGEAVAQRGRLNNSLVGELLVGGRNNRQARGGLVSARHTGRLGSKPRHRVLVGTVTFGRLLVKSGLDNVSLLFSH